MKSVNLRLLAGLGVAVIAVVLLLAVALGVIVRSDWFSEQLKARLERETGRKVAFSSISPSFWFGAGARADDLTLFDEDGVTPCLEAGGVTLKMRLIPLLWRTVSIRSVVVDEPRLTLVRGGDGRWNIESLFKREEPPSGPVSPAAVPRRREKPIKPLFSVSTLRIRKGLVTASDPAWGRELVVKGLGLTVTGIAPGELPAISGSGRVEGIPLRDLAGRVKELNGVDIRGGLLSGEVTVDGDVGGELRFRSAWLLSGLLLSRGDNYESSAGGLDLTVKADGDGSFVEGLWNIRRLNASGPAGRLKASGSLVGIGGAPEVALKIEGRRLLWRELGEFRLPSLEVGGEATFTLECSGTKDDMAIDLDLDLGASRLSYGNLFEKREGIEASAAFPLRFGEDAVRWEGATLNCAGLRLVSGGSLGRTGDRFFRARLAGEGCDLSAAGSLFRGDVSLEGRADIDIEVVQPLDRPFSAAAVSGRAGITGGRARFPALAKPVGYDAVLEISNSAGQIGFDAVRLGNSIAEGRVEFDLRDEPVFDCDLHCPVIDTGDFAPPAKKRTSLRHRWTLVSAAEAAEGAPAEAKAPPTPFAGRIKGKGRITIGELRIGKARSRNGRLRFLVSDGRVRTEVLHLPFYGGLAAGEIGIDFSGSRTRYALDTGLTDVQLERLLSDIYGYGDSLSGRLFADCVAEAEGRFSVKDGLGARGRFSIRDGKLRSFGFIREMAPLFLLLGRQAKAKELVALGELFRKAPSETTFSHCEGSFTFKGERWGMGDVLLEIAGRRKPVKMKLEGTLNSDGSLAVVGRVSFPRGSPYHAQLSPFFPDDDGWITLPFPIPIGGTLEKPRIDPDAARQGVLECAAAIGRLRLRKEVERKIDKMIAAPTPKPGEKPDPSDIGREFLGEAIKGLLKQATENIK